ncbi:DNA damage-inducible protein D [bacterium]|nr:DNA damage-inducible protein D [bacterium]MBU1065698.1 DNA damage-inducible protein D [bacterium]MBU1635558.1 DNA damage-inducible protein D [bacterium]MBU1874241.1 DNA damage-inducible protein D [bacterium]
MKKAIIEHLTQDFESYTNQTRNDIEFWFARDLQHLLGYTEWRNFTKVIDKAKTACETTGHLIGDHFVDINKTIAMPKGASKDIPDYMLSRFACYLIAQNGDPQKEQIAFAQNYFAVQTRKYEIIERRISDWERLQARHKLSFSEKELSGLIFERTGNEKDFGIIRSQGDKALFGFTTSQMKERLGVQASRPLADFLPTITIKAKDFATEITIFNVKEKDIHQGNRIAWEHITNNQSVRKILLERGIRPEDLPPEEDVKKLERRVKSEDNLLLENPDKLASA